MNSPADVGLPAKFVEWRRGQRQAIESLLESDKRFNGLLIPTGGGKCHRRGQGLLRANGQIVRVEDVRVGDRLIGPSGPRRVMSLSRGTGQMYEIRPVKGEPWVVNEHHVLTLTHTVTGKLKDSSVLGWLRWSKTQKHLWKLTRSELIEFRSDGSMLNPLPLDPYFLGIILGDGSFKSGVKITKPDPEIKQEVELQAYKFDLRVREYMNSSGCPTYSLSGESSRWHKNPIMERLELLGLRGVRSEDRFVPLPYLVFPSRGRREVLAGLLDTDGHLVGGNRGYDYISKSQSLANGVVFLARSLGLAAYVAKCTKSCQNNFTGTYYRVSVSGDLDRIPCRIKRKKSGPRLQKKNVLRTGFSVRKLGIEDYYGFTLDGDGRYLLDDFTITHNSAIYMGYTGVDEGRAAVLTYDRALQDQLLADSFGLVDMRGRQNYTCEIDKKKTAAEAVCTVGVFCQNMKTGPCDYYDQKRVVAEERRVVTNYSYWLHNEESGDLGKFQTLVLDEAHRAPDAISEFAAVELSGADFDRYRIPRPGHARIKDWGPRALQRVEDTGRAEYGTGDHDRIRRTKDIQRKLARLCRLHGEEWVLAVRKGARGGEWYRWDLVDPGTLAESLLFRGAERIILASASVRRKTFQLLGVSEKIQVIEQESSFPVKSRPIYYWPIVKMRWGMPEEEESRLYRGIDQIVGQRLDRKGLVHSVSYKRAKEIWQRSQYRDSGWLICDDYKMAAEDVLARFRAAEPPCVLVSPRFSTGIDFPGDECEYAIVPKVPWPDFKAPLMAARIKRDKDYPAYVTAQTLQQSVGRHHRGKDEVSETFILDSSFNRLRYCYKEFFGNWFTNAIRTLRAGERPPDPPKK